MSDRTSLKDIIGEESSGKRIRLDLEDLRTEKQTVCMQYAFKPADVDTTSPAPVLISSGTGEARVSLKRGISGDTELYKGTATVSSERDFVLVYDRDAKCFRLRRIHNLIRGLKFRESATALEDRKASEKS